MLGLNFLTIEKVYPSHNVFCPVIHGEQTPHYVLP